MPKLVFVDVETTGLEERDRICEIALIGIENEEVYASSSLCKSSKKIDIAAMALHHITNEMLKGAPSCSESSTYVCLQENNMQDNVLIGHNINFDIKMLEKEGFSPEFQLVDTLRCVKSLIPECEIFQLQYLRYELLLYKDEEALAKSLGVDINAHRALSDTLHTKLLYDVLLQYATLSQLIEISSKPVLMQKLLFGKYSGRYIEEIMEIDPSYLQWVLSLEDVDEDLAYSIKYYL